MADGGRAIQYCPVVDGYSDPFSVGEVETINMVEYKYYKEGEYAGPFGNLLWDRNVGKYHFHLTPDGQYVRREDYERATNEDN